MIVTLLAQLFGGASPYTGVVSTTLAIANVLHTQAADSPVVTTGGGAFSYASTAPPIGAFAFIRGYGQAAAATLSISDVAHAQLVDGNLVVSSGTLIAISDITHSLTSGNLDLTQIQVLVIADIAHAQLVANLTLGTGADLPGEVLMVQHEGRTIYVLPESRVLFPNRTLH